MADTPSLLHAAQLTVARDGRTVLADVGVDVRAGDRLAVLGPNGAGKSTFLKAVAGLLPAQGTLTLGDRPVHTLTPEERARRLAYVPQHSVLSAPLPVHEVVAQGRFAHRRGLGRPSSVDRASIDRAMSEADVTALADRPFTRLSYGERRRVLLARALATGAPLLVLDEPTAALDVGHALSLFAVLGRLADAGHGIVVVLHALHEAWDFASRALLLAQGRPVAYGAVDQVLSQRHVREVYGVDLLPKEGFAYRLVEGPVP